MTRFENEIMIGDCYSSLHYLDEDFIDLNPVLVFKKVLEKLYELTHNNSLVVIATAQVSPNFFNDPYLAEIPAGNQYINTYFSEYIYLNSFFSSWF